MHLRNEFAIGSDGHRPMNEGFRAACDAMLLKALDDMEIPYLQIGGTVPERLTAIVERFGLPVVRDLDEAIELAGADYEKVDWRLEKVRRQSAAAAVATSV